MWEAGYDTGLAHPGHWLASVSREGFIANDGEIKHPRFTAGNISSFIVQLPILKRQNKLVFQLFLVALYPCIM